MQHDAAPVNLGDDIEWHIETSGRMWAFVPAYAALATALGAALYALGNIISDAAFVWKIWLLLGLGIAYSFAARGENRTVKSVCNWLLLLLLLVFPPLTLLSPLFALIPPDAATDSNTYVTIVMGWLVLVSLFAVGVRHNKKSVPFTAPLVPALSLFGLLNIISLNSVVGSCFLVFVASSLYLAAYERWLERERTNEIKATNSFSNDHATKTAFAQWGDTARSYVLASFAWFVLFVAGAAILYLPFRWILPATLPATLSAASLYAKSASGDWRQSPPVIELTGGTYSLSTREIMRITVAWGPPSGLWRGHIYEHYVESRWLETPTDIDSREVISTAEQLVLLAKGHIPSTFFTMQPRFRTGARKRNQSGMETDSSDALAERPNLNAAGCRGDACRTVIETVEPLQSLTTSVLASGFPFAVQGDLGTLVMQPNATTEIQQSSLRGNSYSIHSQVNTTSPAIQEKAAGLTAAQKKQWQSDPRTAPTLALQRDFGQRVRLQQIADQILQRAQKAGVEIDTPARKVRAVKNYLAMRCRYSLQSPAIPSNEDAVLFFLRNSKVGACDMFASSSALLLRAMSVPTRLASGYIQPEDVKAGTTYTVRERDAHAWIEYYVPSLGWLPFDPTAGVRTVEEEDAALDVLMPAHDRHKAFVFGVPVLALCLFALVAVRTRRTQKPLIISAQPAPTDPELARIRRHYLRALRLMRRHIPRTPGTTPEEYEHAVIRSRLPHAAKLEFSALTYLFIHSQFSAPGAQSEESQMRACLARLQRALRRAPK